MIQVYFHVHSTHIRSGRDRETACGRFNYCPQTSSSLVTLQLFPLKVEYTSLHSELRCDHVVFHNCQDNSGWESTEAENVPVSLCMSPVISHHHGKELLAVSCCSST